MKKILLTALLALPVLVVAQSLDQIIVTVGEDIITERELQQEINLIKMQGGRGTSKKKVLEKMVLQKAAVSRAASLGMNVSEAAVIDSVKSIASENKMSLSAFGKRLTNNGISMAAFKDSVKRQMVMGSLRRMEVTQKVEVPNSDIDRAAKKLKAKLPEAVYYYHLGHILIAVPSSASGNQKSDLKSKAKMVLSKARSGQNFTKLAQQYSDGQNAPDGGKMGWRSIEQVPSLLQDRVRGVDRGGVVGLIESSSGFHIVKVLDKKSNLPEFVANEYKTQHILIKVDKIMSDEYAKSKLSEIRNRILNGEDFGELAIQFSDDPGNRNEGGDLGWVREGQMVAEFEAMMKRMPRGEVSPVFKTPFGYHILKVNGKRSVNATNDVFRNKARADLVKQMAKEDIDAWEKKILDEAYIEYHVPQYAP